MDSCESCDREQFVALLKGLRLAPEGGGTVEELDTLTNWAHAVHTRSAILDLLLAGEIVVIGFRGAQPVFASPEAADAKDAIALAEQIVGS